MRINRKSILTALAAVSPGLSQKEIIEQSASFVFRNGRVITFNDEVACSIECDIGVEGAVVAAPLMALLQKLEEEELDIEQAENELRVKTGRRKAGIRMDQEVSLPVEGIEDPSEWTALPEGFLDAIGIAQQCASSNESEFVLTCVHLHPKWVEACDQFQIARYPIKTGLKESTLIRRSSLKSVMGMDVVEYSQTENWLHFRNPAGLQLSCRRYSQKYPPLDEFLNVEGVETTLPKGLEAAVDKANIFSALAEEGNLITIAIRRGKIKLTGCGSHGWYSEVQKIESYDGDDMQFAIAPNLLVEITKRSSKCELAEGRLKIKTDRWIYVSCTSLVKNDI